MSVPLRILLVEDSEDDAILIMRALRRGGYEPSYRRVETPQAMQEALSHEIWDLVIADYAMPRFTGLAALELLHSNDLDLPFIIVSGTIGEGIAVAAMKAGAHDYVMKDNLTRLIPAVERELREAQVRRARKQTEKALQKSEARYRTLIDDVLNSSTVGVFILDADFKVVWVNQALERYFGLQSAEILGKDKRRLIKESIRDIFEDPTTFTTKVLATYDNNTYAENFECHVLSGEGRDERWLEHHSQPIRSGLYTGGRIEHYYDITERKRSAQILTGLNQAALVIEQALTPADIFATVAEELNKLGFQCTIFLTDETKNKLFVKHLSYESRAVKAAERLVGLKAESFGFPIDSVDAIKRVVQEREPFYSVDVQNTVDQILPRPLNRFAKRVVQTLRVPKSINAPLVVQDEVIGVLSVQSDDLTRRDVPAMVAFAHLVAAAWRRAQLFERAQQEISERKQAEEAKRQSEERFKNVFENAPIGIYRTTPDGKILMANPALIRMLHYESFEDLTKLDLERDRSTAKYRRAAFKQRIEKEGQVFGFEAQWDTKEGMPLFIRENAKLVLDEAGQPLYYDGTVEDITENRRAEQLLQTLNRASTAMERALTPEEIFTALSEELKRMGFQSAVFLVSEDKKKLYPKYLSYNPDIVKAAEKLAGAITERVAIPIERVEVFKKPILERHAVFVDNIEDATYHALPKAIRGFTKPILSILNVQNAINLPLIIEGEVVGLLAVNSDDLKASDLPAMTAFSHQVAATWHKARLFEQAQQEIAERKRAEAEREELLSKIQAQAEQLEQIMNTVPEGVLLLDAEAHVVLANPPAKKYLITLSDKASTESLTKLGNRALKEILTSPPQGLWHEVATDNVSKKHTTTFEVIARPIETGPTPSGWVLVVRDVTREREVQEHIQQQDRLAAVGQLAAGIAHDFNNIMATIVLYAQMMTRNPYLSARDQERLVTINQQAMHATNLIQQILDFSRRAVLERRPMDLLPFLKEQVKLLKRTLPEDISINFEAGAEEYTVNADPTRIQQAVMNLSLNARDAMPDGGELTIGLDLVAIDEHNMSPRLDAHTGPWVKITIEDTGVGIPEENLSRIFEPFFTTKPPGQGSGLGLPQVHGIVRQHKGQIYVESEVSQGTVFTIYLPSLAAKPRAMQEQKTDTLIEGHGETILIVEDDAITQQALVESLELLNYHVLTASNGQEALEALEAHHSNTQAKPIDLILSDVVMPTMGGIALLHALRERGLGSRVLLLTGHPLQKELEDLREKEMSSTQVRTPFIVEWLLKPPSLEKLAEVIGRILREST